MPLTAGTMGGSVRWRFWPVAGATAFFLSLSCVNPNLINTATAGSLVPLAPGSQNFVLIQLINNSSFFLDGLVSVELTGGMPPDAQINTVFANIRPGGGDAAVVLECPVDRVGLGDLDDPSSPGFRVGLTPQGKTGVAWGRPPLVSGFNYSCGDAIVFVAINDPTSNGSVRIDAGVVSGASQPAPAIDTFGNLQAVLTSNGF